MAIVTTSLLIDAGLSFVLDKAATGLVARTASYLADRKVRSAVVTACTVAIEAAVLIAPELAADLRSESFIKQVAVPTVLTIVANPSSLPDAKGLAGDFVRMFVARFASDDDVDQTLQRLFLTDRRTLEEAAEQFFISLRSEFAAVPALRSLAQFMEVAETRRGVSALLRLHQPTPAPMSDPQAVRAEGRRGSRGLLNWPRDIWGAQIERPEFATLLTAVNSHPAATTLLIGDAGSGKSALLSSVTQELINAGRTVFAIKADKLPETVTTPQDVASALGIEGSIVDKILSLANVEPVVVIIDQLDAVSEIMDRRSERMRVLLQIVAELRPRLGDEPAIHVLISSRPFEADHDARFQQLDADVIRLELPAWERVAGLLHSLDIDPAIVPATMGEMIRRPFALKLFVDLVKRGVAVGDLLPSQLLSRWLDTADFGGAGERRDVLALLTKLAEDMLDTESLWRPADIYALTDPAPLRRALATGLLIRNEIEQVAFSHQSWLDDFQVRGLTTPKRLVDFAWSGQDSLFPRATVLRALQRMRAYEPGAYLEAVDRLLSDTRTRRHLRHLVIDFIATAEPLAREAAWIRRLIDTDAPLARRALALIARHWPSWRAIAGGWLEGLMREDLFAMSVVSLLIEEARFDPDGAATLMAKGWDEPQRDTAVVLVIERSNAWTPTLAKRLAVAAHRTAIDPHIIASLVNNLRKAGRTDDAVDVVGTYLEAIVVDDATKFDLYKIEKLAEDHPKALAQRLLPWFVKLAAAEVEDDSSLRDLHPHSCSLPWDWDYADGRNTTFQALRIALDRMGRAEPSGLYDLLAPHIRVKIDAVQQVIVDALTAAGPALANESLTYLLDDPRRFYVGEAHGTATDGIGRTITGWSSQQLVGAIAPGLDHVAQVRLCQAIEAWSPYSSAVMAELGPEDRRQRRIWAEDARLPLFEPLDDAVIGLRRRRQITEWRRQQPVFKSPMRSIGMAHRVCSSMSADEMARASDDALMRLLDEVHDAVSERWTRKRPLEGGVNEVASAFGEFAKEHPERALALVETRFEPSRHQAAAGAAIREAAATCDPERLRRLIHALDGRGFDGRSFRNDCGWALQSIAHRLGGLGPEDLAVIEGWIVVDPAIIAEETARRRQLDALNAERNAPKEQSDVRPLLFGRYGGMRIVPQKNYTFLEAIACGHLYRSPPDHAGFVAALLRHLERPEDPAIWSHLLLAYGHTLWWVDDAEPFWQRLRRCQPEALADIDVVHTLWRLRSRIPSDVIESTLAAWLSGPARNAQAAGELVGAINLVDVPAKPEIKALLRNIMEDASPARTGALLSASAAWREREPDLRRRAHAMLLSAMVAPSSEEAQAIATATKGGELIPNELTRQFLDAIRPQIAILESAFDSQFPSALQALLVHPGFDEPILALLEAVVASNILDRTGRSYGPGSELVPIAVALQRSDGEFRARAMNVYEALLDAEIYGARAAAEAALRS